MRHWDGSRWIADGASVNATPEIGEAGRPSLTAEGGTLWLAWAEGTPGQKAQVMVRSLSQGAWRRIEGGLNTDTANGAADGVVIAVRGEVPYIAWAEKTCRPSSPSSCT